jgi:hypothetical protein
MTAADVDFSPNLAQTNINTLQCGGLKQLVGLRAQRKELTMPRVLACVWIVLCASSLAFAGDLTPKQQKMQDCNADARAKGLRGDEQQKFMSACLSARAPESKGTVQPVKKR